MNYYAEWNGNLYRFFSRYSRNVWRLNKRGVRLLMPSDPRVIEAERKVAEKRRIND